MWFILPTGCARLGFYGNNCDQPCSERCPERRCDITNGDCLSCLPGWTGHTCEKSKDYLKCCKIKIIFNLTVYAYMNLLNMYQIFVTQNVHLDHSVRIVRQFVVDIVEIHVITLVEYATTAVWMVGWDNTATNVSKYIFMD